MLSRVSYHPHPAAALNFTQFEDYSPPPCYSDAHLLYSTNQRTEPPPYFSHSLRSDKSDLATVKESPVEESFECETPGSRKPFLQDENVFFPEFCRRTYSELTSSVGNMSNVRVCKNNAMYSSAPKSSSGMKNKIKSSLDKLKPFVWGSADKIDSYENRKSKCCKNKGNIRRYSDSIAPASIDCTNTVLTKRLESSSSYSDVFIRKTTLSDTPAIPPNRPQKKGAKFMKSYFAGGKLNGKGDSKSPVEEYLSINISDKSYVVNSYKPNYDQADTVPHKEDFRYVEIPPKKLLQINNPIFSIHKGNGKYRRVGYNPKSGNPDILKPKGTWNLLKMSSQQPTPTKPQNYSRLYQQMSISNNCDNLDTPPPEIAPISGRLLTERVSFHF